MQDSFLAAEVVSSLEREREREQEQVATAEADAARRKEDVFATQAAAAQAEAARCKEESNAILETTAVRAMAVADKEAVAKGRLDGILDAAVTAVTRAAVAEAAELSISILSDIVQVVLSDEGSTGDTQASRVSSLVDEILDFCISAATSKDDEEEKARKSTAAEADFRVLEAELAAKRHEEEEEAEACQKVADAPAERRLQEERERKALARTVIMMQKLFRGKQARGFACDLRKMRALQMARFEEEEKTKARDAVTELKRRVPLQVLEFKQRFHAIVDGAWAGYKDKTASIMATPDMVAHATISVEILALWAGAAIANEAAIAAALVDSARSEVRKGLVLGRVMRGALEQDSLQKGLDKVNSTAQQCLSTALREHLSLAPETVEERMASLKISIDAKKRLQTYVELECEKVWREMADLTQPAKKDSSAGPLLMGILASADAGSALGQWAPLSHLPGDLNRMMLKSRQRATVKESIRHRSHACQQRWHALEANLDYSRGAFTNSVLGISAGRGWDRVAAKSACEEASSYSLVLADALSFLSPPSSAANANARREVNETSVLKRRVANLFTPKRLYKPTRNQSDAAIRGGETSSGVQTPWPDWQPGKFRRKHRDSLFAQYARTSEAHFITEVHLSSSGSPRGHNFKREIHAYTVLPRIVTQNFDHILRKLNHELDFRRENRDERSLRHASPIVREEQWQHIRRISKMDPAALPTKELFPTPRRLQK